MKKLLSLLICLSASFICVNTVSAKVVDLTSAEYNNSYVVGNRIFKLGSYVVTLPDVVKATDEWYQYGVYGDTTFDVINHREGAPIFYVNNGYLYPVKEDGTLVTDDKLAIQDLVEDYGKFDVWGIDNGKSDFVIPEEEVIPYEEEKVTAKVNDVVDVLKKSAEGYGFSDISYDSANHKVTFQIDDESKSIKDYAKSGIVDFVKAFVSDEFGVESVSMGGMSYEGIKDIPESELITWCAGAIKSTIGEDAEDKLSSLQGKTIEVTVTYADETEITYTIAFN